MSFSISVTASERGRMLAGGDGIGRLAGIDARQRHRAPAPPRHELRPARASLRRHRRRQRFRAAAAAATAGPARCRCGSHRRAPTSGAPSAISKSCAAWPCRRSSGSRPSAIAMLRDSQGPGSAAAGQTPFVETGEDDEIERQQPRFEQAEDRDADRFRRRRPHAQPGRQALESSRRDAGRRNAARRPASADSSSTQRIKHVGAFRRDCFGGARRRSGPLNVAPSAAGKFGGSKAAASRKPGQRRERRFELGNRGRSDVRGLALRRVCRAG